MTPCALELNDLFAGPVGDERLVYLVAITGAACAVFGTLALVGRFFAGQRRIMLTSDPSEPTDP